MIGGIGVAGFPQVGLASATSNNAKDSIRIIINKIVVAITALLIATNPAPLYSIAVLLLNSTHGTPNQWAVPNWNIYCHHVLQERNSYLRVA